MLVKQEFNGDFSWDIEVKTGGFHEIQHDLANTHGDFMGLNLKTKVAFKVFFLPTGTTDKNWQIYHQFRAEQLGYRTQVKNGQLNMPDFFFCIVPKSFIYCALQESNVNLMCRVCCQLEC